MLFSSRFTDALIFATNLHSKQVRRGSNVPYISHLLGVCSLVIEYGGNEDEAIAALLHDAIEDQGGAKIREEIRTLFGDLVTSIVDGCTDSDVTPKPPWKERKLAYLEHLKTASPSVKLVSAADKLYNANSIIKDYRLIGDKLWSRFHGQKDGTLWYYRSLADTFLIGEITPLITELNRVVSELENLATL
jgi:(p)ppGpp synthase/HD superfamily hydrolase